MERDLGNAVARTEERLRQMLLRGLSGDAAAYHTFLKDLSAHLRAYLRKRLLRFPHDVEDLTQEALLAVHNQRHTYCGDRPLTAWVHAIARYKLVDWLRARHAGEALNDPWDDDQEILASSDAQADEARRDLGKLLQQLPDRHRLPILHVKVQGMSIKEAARMTGMSESAVKVGVHRGLKALAARIRGAA